VTKKEMTALISRLTNQQKRKSCAVLLNVKDRMESWCTEKEITKRNKMSSRKCMNYLNLKQLQRDLGLM